MIVWIGFMSPWIPEVSLLSRSESAVSSVVLEMQCRQYSVDIRDGCGDVGDSSVDHDAKLVLETYCTEAFTSSLIS